MNVANNTLGKYKHIPFLGITIIAVALYIVSIAQEKYPFWEIMHNIAQDVIISMIFYYLLVYIPEKRKNNRIKKNLQLAFEDFKLNLLYIYMNAGKISEYNTETIKKLLNIHEFRKYFEGQRWDDLIKGLSHNPKLVHTILENITDLKKDFLFSLYNADISDNDMYYFLKNSVQSLNQFSHIEDKTEALKPLTDFLWDMFSRVHWSNGQLKKDQMRNIFNKS